MNIIQGKNVRAYNRISKVINDKNNLKNSSDSQENNQIINKKIKLIKNGYFAYKQIILPNESLYTAAFGVKGKIINENYYETSINCFTDIELNNQYINTIKPIFWNSSLKKISLFHKYMSLLTSESNYDKKFIWIDSRITISNHIRNQIISTLDGCDLVLFSHYERSDIYDELNAIFKAKRASIEQISNAFKFFRDNSFHTKELFETGIIGFKLTAHIQKLFTSIYGFCNQHIQRDQIAMPYLLINSGVNYKIFNNGQTNLRNTEGIEVKTWK